MKKGILIAIIAAIVVLLGVIIFLMLSWQQTSPAGTNTGTTGNPMIPAPNNTGASGSNGTSNAGTASTSDTLSALSSNAATSETNDAAVTYDANVSDSSGLS